jgi:4a-hydroxytetrahydrobiopterin dehydratase
MSELAEKKCVPCQGGIPPLSKAAEQELLAKVDGWQIIDSHHLTKSYTFDNFIDGLQWVNTVGAIAEKEGHHPDIYLAWGSVRVEIWTHKIDGLTESDFILAAKYDAAWRG